MKKCLASAMAFVAIGMMLTMPAQASVPFVISTLAGDGSFVSVPNGQQATSGGLLYPSGPLADSAGNVYFAEPDSHRVRKVAPDGVISTVAGGGVAGYSGDGGPATSAQLNKPGGLAFNSAGELLIADCGSPSVRKVSSNGTITTIAGTGVVGSSGLNGPATAAQLNDSCSVAVSPTGDVYIGEWDGNRVTRIDSSGVLRLVAGTGVDGYNGDGIAANTAQVNRVSSIAIDSQGALYIAEYGGHRLRKVAAGIITTVVGTGVNGFSGDGGLAINATVRTVSGVTVDSIGNLYVADSSSSVVRRVNTNGIISTIAGTGVGGYSGDGGQALEAQLDEPVGLTVTPAGHLLITDWGSSTVRQVNNIIYADGSVALSLEVAPSFSLTIAGRSSACNGVAPTGSATPSAVSLGGANSSAPVSASQDITVSSNANSGFVVFQRGGQLTGSKTIDAVAGTNNSPGAFGSGERFGYTTDDVNVPGFAGPLWAALSATSVPLMLRPNVGPGTATNCVAYQFRPAANTPAGLYSTTVIYSAVPTF